MKKILAIFVLSSQICIRCFAQFNVYHPFPTANAWWSEASSGFNGSCYSTNEYDYYISNDTTVNGKTYHVVHTSGGFGFGQCPPGPLSTAWSSYDRVYSAIREDTAKHIYMLFNSKDTLLYDFNLKVGDTIPNTANNEKRYGNYIYSIDSILIGISYRKQFIIANDTGISAHIFDSIIEGIGSTEGLFEEIQVPFEFSSGLDCFKQNGITIYPFLSDSCQEFVLGTPTIKQQPIDISIYPNPSNGIFMLSCHSEQSEESPSILSVYNVLGEKVFTETLRSTQGDNTIDMGNQPNGVYFYRVLTEDESLIGEGKLVIEK